MCMYVCMYVCILSNLFAAAMNQLTKNLACEWAKDNIRSNCVVPWAIRTPLAERVTFLSFVLQDAIILYMV